MRQKKIILVAGARPNFMKIAPILRAMDSVSSISNVLVHTGQHYDANMSQSFFRDLGIKNPDYSLEAGSGTHAVQTAQIMIKFEEVCVKENPDLVMVVGDVNSTIAAGLVAKKLHIELAHVEAGLRSGDRSMPEEINRLATDAISDLFFTTEKAGRENLLKEGVPSAKIHFVGHVMIDNLLFQIQKLAGIETSLSTYSLKKRLPGKYACMTLHRPSNVDSKPVLEKIFRALNEVGNKIPIIFPCHPRTRKQIADFGFMNMLKEIPQDSGNLAPDVYITDPLGYNEFLLLWKDAALVLTDSGGLQEETTALKIPCITIRESTERPVTAEIGSNEVVGTDPDKIIRFSNSALSDTWKSCVVPEFWDGKASERIVAVLQN